MAYCVVGKEAAERVFQLDFERLALRALRCRFGHAVQVFDLLAKVADDAILVGIAESVQLGRLFLGIQANLVAFGVEGSRDG